VTWEDAPGTFGTQVFRTGTRETARTGIAVLKITYSDGAEGILLVSCRQADTPGPVFEGVLGTHGFESYYAHEFAVAMPFVDANRTIFHVIGPALRLPATGDGNTANTDGDAEGAVEGDAEHELVEEGATDG
jgi:hypothetical protein